MAPAYICTTIKIAQFAAGLLTVDTQNINLCYHSDLGGLLIEPSSYTINFITHKRMYTRFYTKYEWVEYYHWMTFWMQYFANYKN